MKILTSNLIGKPLDFAVTKALLNEELETAKDKALWLLDHDIDNGYSPSTIWNHGGPISEKKKLWVRYITHDDVTKNHWVGISGWFPKIVESIGPTELIAKMRCIVAMELGNEVEIPEELLS